MINIKNNNITIPYGEVIEFDYIPSGIVLEPEDIVVLTIKKKLGDKDAIIREEYQGIQHYGNIVHVNIPSDKSKQLSAGTYNYDLVLINKDKGKHKLLLGPARIKITEVVNNE